MWRYSPTSDIFSYWRYEQIFDCLILWNKSSEIVRQVYYLVVWTPSNDFRQQSTYKWWWRLISSRSSPHSTSFFLLVNRQDGSPLFPNFSSIADDGKPTLMGPTAFNCSIHQNTSNYINSINRWRNRRIDHIRRKHSNILPLPVLSYFWSILLLFQRIKQSKICSYLQ